MPLGDRQPLIPEVNGDECAGTVRQGDLSGHLPDEALTEHRYALAEPDLRVPDTDHGDGKETREGPLARTSRRPG